MQFSELNTYCYTGGEARNDKSNDGMTRSCRSAMYIHILLCWTLHTGAYVIYMLLVDQVKTIKERFGNVGGGVQFCHYCTPKNFFSASCTGPVINDKCNRHIFTMKMNDISPCGIENELTEKAVNLTNGKSPAL